MIDYKLIEYIASIPVDLKLKRPNLKFWYRPYFDRESLETLSWLAGRIMA